MGIIRCVPKEAGNLKVDKQRPITLLNTRCKLVTMTLKIGMQDYLKTVIPPNQKGFVQGRNMHEHLLSVQEIQREGETGAWVTMDFTKAFDTVSHPMLEAFLLYAGMPSQWVAVILEFLRGPLGFIVGRRVSETYIKPTGGIRQGDTLSPSLFVLLTSILCRKLSMELPQCKVFLYADDSMVWVPGTPAEVQAQTLRLTEIMSQYARYTGQALNLAKSKAVLQGDWGPMTVTSVGGIDVVG